MLSAPTLVKRVYGFPFRGFRSSVKKIACLPDEITDSSHDVLISPAEGKLVSRLGTRRVRSHDPSTGDVNFTSGSYPSRALAITLSYTPKVRQALRLISKQATDGYPLLCVLYGYEATGDKRCVVYFLQTSGANSYDEWIGYEVRGGGGNTDYPQGVNGVDVVFYWKVMPLPYTLGVSDSAGAVTMSRGISGLAGTAQIFLDQEHLFIGSRNAVESQRGIHLPSLYGTPATWNRVWNESNSGGQHVRVSPWGNLPPLFSPTATTPVSAGTDTTKFNWRDGDSFYISCMFRYSDGSLSQPFIPRAVQAGNVLGNPGGSVTVGNIQTSGTTIQYYPFVRYQLPVGPPDVTERLILRTGKVNLSNKAATNVTNGVTGGSQTLQEVPIGQLRVTAIIRNNTQLTYDDYNGNDTSLVPDDGRTVRFDNTLCPPARHAFAFDQRLAVGFTRTHLGAIVLAPANQLQETASSGATAYYAGVDSSGIITTNRLTGYPASPSNGVNWFTNTYGAAGQTLQDLVDAMNVGFQSGLLPVSGAWCAQLVPGVDPNAPITALAATYFTVTGCTVSTGTTVTSSAGFADVAVGMQIRIQGSRKKVIAKASNSSITLDAAVTNGAATAEFAFDVADDWVNNNVQIGLVRAYSPAFPVILPFKASYLEGLPSYENKRDIWFTVGAPSTASVGSQFVIANRRTVPADAGMFMGGAPLLKGAALWYSSGLYTIENRKAGSTGEDVDERVYPLNRFRGCIASATITSAHGVSGALTPDGYVLTDGEREVVISADIWNPALKTGELSYEIPQSQIAVDLDSDGSYASADIHGTILYLRYRSAAGTFADEQVRYDFSGSVGASGLAAFLKPDGSPWGWSSPETVSVAKSVVIASSARPLLIGASDKFTNQSQPGRNIELDYTSATGNFDDSIANTVTVTATSGSNALTGAAGAFANVAVGAQVYATTLGTVNVPKTTVVSKTSTSVTLANGCTGSGSSAGSIQFWGQVISPLAYMAMDTLGQLKKKKSAQNATVLHKDTNTAGTGTQSLYHSNDKARASQTTYTLATAATAGEQTREVVELSQAARSPGDVCEFAWANDGQGQTQVEFYGLEAEIELVDSVV